jgi:hypothetical protein
MNLFYNRYAIILIAGPVGFAGPHRFDYYAYSDTNKQDRPRPIPDIAIDNPDISQQVKNSQSHQKNAEPHKISLFVFIASLSSSLECAAICRIQFFLGKCPGLQVSNKIKLGT